MKKYIPLIFSLILVFIPSIVNAKECDIEFKNTMLQLVNQININYEYLDTNNKFTLKISNVPTDVGVNESTGNYPIDINNNIYKISNIDEGHSIQLLYFYSGEKCNEFVIKKKDIRLPFYNEYWNSDICKRLEEYKYCKKYTTTDIKYDFLKQSVDSYKEKNTAINVEIEKEQFLKNKYFIIICVGAVTLLILMILIVHIKKRSEVKI